MGGARAAQAGEPPTLDSAPLTISGPESGCALGLDSARDSLQSPCPSSGRPLQLLSLLCLMKEKEKEKKKSGVGVSSRANRLSEEDAR